MERGKYARTRRGQAAAKLKRQMRRFTLMIDQQPQSKNIRAEDAVAFQEAVLEQLESRGQSAYTKRVFLQLDFHCASKTPPAIYRLPKNYMDLLEKPRPDLKTDRPRLLFRNDRQVKALVVRYHLDGPAGKPSVWVQAEPFRDFLADVDLVERITRDDFEDDDDRRYGYDSDEFRHGPFHAEDGWDRKFEEFVEFERDKDSWLRFLGNDAFESHRQMMRMMAQQEHLQRTDRFTCRGLLGAMRDCPRSKGQPHDDMMKRLAAITRNMTIRAPFVLELHHAPHREGDGDVFRTVLQSALEDFKAKHKFLFPLSSLLNVTVLMVPPEGGGKDLDNLTTMILKALHEIWTPPSHLVHTVKTDKLKDEGIKAHWEATRAQFPKEPKYSVTEYRAFELPRFPDDPKDGFVRLAVGDGLHPVRFHEEIEDFIDNWRDSLGH